MGLRSVPIPRSLPLCPLGFLLVAKPAKLIQLLDTTHYSSGIVLLERAACGSLQLSNSPSHKLSAFNANSVDIIMDLLPGSLE